MDTEPDSEAPQLHLQVDFPPVSTAEWEAIIEADLQGANYEQKLTWRTVDGIVVRPYYRREDLDGFGAQTRVAPGVYPFVRGNGSQVWEMKEPGSEPPAGAIRVDILHASGNNVVQELAYAMLEGAKRLEAASDVDEAASAISFVFAMGPNYFFQIAKLRAARLLWAKTVSAFQPKSEASCRMRTHARVTSTRWGRRARI